MRARQLSPVLISLLVISAIPARRAGSQAPQRAAAETLRVDPFWPGELPHNWMVGHVVGVSIDSHDHIWVTHRPNSSQYAAKTPPVLEFDQAGNLLQSWGGPGPGYEWGTQVHSIYTDYKDNVWIGFGGGLPYDPKKNYTTDNALVLKFTPQGKFLLQIGKFGKGTEGSNSAQYLGNPTDVFVDPRTDEVFISDGYINHRVIVFDANTGSYKRHWGAYGKRPDDGYFTRAGERLPSPFSGQVQH